MKRTRIRDNKFKNARTNTKSMNHLNNFDNKAFSVINFCSRAAFKQILKTALQNPRVFSSSPREPALVV